jgi:formyl-CoA transferase
MLTIDSPFFVTGSKKVQPRKPPSLGQHSKEVLEECGYDNAALEKLRESGAVNWG